ncbi:MAG: Rab family GTPase [Candidatus Hodarchaeales archaeon]|jgi:small GTP-binding protein
MAEDTLKYKVVLAGEGAVGKTTLINRFVTGSFSADYKATIGVQIFSKLVNLDNDKEVNLQLWDIAGQTLFRNLRTKFFQNASGALLVFDLTIPSTLENLHTWISDIKTIAGNIPFVLIGNKVDLTGLKSITQDDVNSFIMDHFEDIRVHYDTSALTGINVEQAFLDLVKNMV